MKKKIIISIVIAFTIAGIVFGYSYFRRGKDDGLQYKKEALKKGNIQALVITTGTLNPVTIVDVGSQVSGNILKINVDFNSLVKEGEVIAEINQEQFLTKVKQNEANYQSSRAALDKSRVSLDNAKKKYDRAKNLFEKELISFEEFETAEAQFYNAKADLQSAEARLEQTISQLDSSKVDLAYTIIKSPIEGIVINRRVNIGQTVAASFQAPVLFQIANDLSKMQVECSIDEADIGKVKEGQDVTFTVDAFPNDRFSGKVAQVRYSPEVVQNVVTYATIVEVDNLELKLRPGMTAMVSVVIGEAKNKLLVPNSALRFTPQLSPEEMREIFENMRASMGGARRPSQGDNQNRERPTQGQMRQRPEAGGQYSSMSGQGNQGSRMMQRPRVWIEDENGKLKMIFIRTGVTDNSYSEVIGDNLKEGQEVITGVGSTNEGSRDSSRDFRRGMMFMR